MKILFSEGSSTSARGALYALGPNHTIDIVDANPLCQCRFSKYVRRWHRCPRFAEDPEAYLNFLLKLLREGGYDVLIPTHEQVFLIARYQDEIKKYTQLAVPEFAAIDRAIGKADFIRVLQELQLPHPKAKIYASREELAQAYEAPCYVKLSMSTAGGGVHYAENADALVHIANEIIPPEYFDAGGEVILQHPVEGENCGCYGVFRHGQLLASHGVRLRFDNRGGWFTAVEGVDHGAALEAMQKFGAHLNWHGAIALEYFRDPKTDQIYFIECNPRIGETFNATISGVNICEQLVKVALEQEVHDLKTTQFGKRSHQSFLMLMSHAVNGRGRLGIASELLRQLVWGGPLYRNSEDELTKPIRDPWSMIPRVAVTLQLLVWPGLGRKMVASTVRDYALSQPAVEKIRKGELAIHERS